MPPLLTTAEGRSHLARLYRQALVEDVLPFWLRHGLDTQHDGLFTSLDRDGSLLDSDKALWLQARACWTFSTLFTTVEPRREWFDAAGSCIAFLDHHGYATDGHLFFTVTREGRPLRMRRGLHALAFAASAHAAYAKASGDHHYAELAQRDFKSFLDHALESDHTTPKIESTTRPCTGVSALIIGIETAQALRANLGHVEILGRSATEWADRFIFEIQHLFFKPDLGALMDLVRPDGAVIDHFEGRTLNPGHALECAWLILHEARLREEKSYTHLGLSILDAAWQRGWDAECGGIYHFRDLYDKPPQEYWHDMKLWAPHCEGLIATALAWKLTGDTRYARWHQQIHDWTFHHFPDPEHGEWYGYLHRDGTPSVRLKGNQSKGPFHLPRMLAYVSRLLEEAHADPIFTLTND